MKSLLTSLFLLLSIFSYSQEKIETRLYYHTSKEIYEIYKYWDLSPTDTFKINDSIKIIVYQSPIIMYPRIAYTFLHDTCLVVDYFFPRNYMNNMKKEFNDNYKKYSKNVWFDDYDVISFVEVKGIKELILIEYKPMKKNKTDYKKEKPVDRFEIFI